jgi:hypothetical protein
MNGIGGAHSRGGGAWPTKKGRAHVQEARTYAPVIRGAYKDAHMAMRAAVANHVVGVGHIRIRLSLEAQTGVRTAPGRRVYMAYPPHLKSPSLLLLALCLTPAKYFAWDFGG